MMWCAALTAFGWGLAYQFRPAREVPQVPHFIDTSPK